MDAIDHVGAPILRNGMGGRWGPGVGDGGELALVCKMKRNLN